MKKKIVTILGYCLIPIGAVLLSGCGPANMDSELNLAENSDQYMRDLAGIPREVHCWDGISDDGDGLVDQEDFDCRGGGLFGPFGPIRDLSIAPQPFSHNFAPVVPGVIPSSPGFGESFRSMPLYVKWLRYLTEIDGNVAGTSVYGPGVNPLATPVPAPLTNRVPQGTYAIGNNNNVFPFNVMPGVGVQGSASTVSSALPPVAPFSYTDPSFGPAVLYKNGSQGLIH